MEVLNLWSGAYDTVWLGELTDRHSGSLDAPEHRDWCKSRGWPAQPGAVYGETWFTYWTDWSWLDWLLRCACILIITIPVLPYIKGWCHRPLISFSDWLINWLHCPVVVQPRLLVFKDTWLHPLTASWVSCLNPYCDSCDSSLSLVWLHCPFKGWAALITVKGSLL